ncbi:MAG: alpha/beta hydrolase [Gemmatimonadaceae bacterium]|nr:alpha/beta hydrolase [Gemmatimonadaceae bacterium]
MKGEFLDVAGARVYCFAAGRRGRGDPMVFLHGFPTSSRIWQPVLGRLPEGHRLLCLDLLGFGRSDPVGGHDVSVAGHATRLGLVLDQLGVTRAALVAHDLGALVALRTAAAQPERFTQLVLVSPPASPTRALKLGVAARRAPASLRRFALRRALRRGWTHEPAAGRRAEVAAWLRPLDDASIERHLREIASSGSDPLLLGDGRVTSRIAVIGGARDPWNPPGEVRRFAEMCGASSVHILDNAGHFVTDDAPQAFADVVHSQFDE